MPTSGSGSASAVVSVVTGASTTRGEIKQMVRQLLMETAGSPLGDEPFWLNQLVTDETDELARRTDAYYTWFDGDIAGSTTTPQDWFCVPRLYKLKAARVRLSSGDYRMLRPGLEIKTPAWMDRYEEAWQTDADSGDPRWLVLARGQMLLYPLPDYSYSPGIRVYGFGVPGPLWTAGSTAEDDSDTFPLPEYAVQTLVYRCAVKRCIQAPTKENMLRLPYLERQAAKLTGMLEGEVATERDRARGGHILEWG